MEDRFCPECGAVIKGRIDKKFCSDLCRNTFNNKANSDVTNYVRNVNNVLRKNRRILEELLQGNEKLTLPRQKLADKGFKFNYFTYYHVTKNNHHYRYCYEYGTLPLENNMVLLVKREWGDI